MKKTVSLPGIIVAMAVSAASLNAQPTVASVVNIASYAVSGLPNAAIAQGALFAVFGTNMGPTTIQFAAGFPLPTNLMGTTITVTTSTTSAQAPIIYTSAGQLAAVLPSNTPAGPATLTVAYNFQPTGAFPFNVVQSNFGAFTSNQAGSGAAIVKDGNNNLITALQPAIAGEEVVLYGTGLGPLPAVDSDANAPPQVTPNVSLQVFVGSVPATVVYKGRSGGFAGLDQINFYVPSGPQGCSVPVVVQIGSTVSNSATMAISTSNSVPCSDPNSIPSTVLQQVSSKGSVNIGVVSLDNITASSNALGKTTTTTSIEGVALFENFGLAAYLQNPSTSSGTPSIGSCVVSTVNSAQTVAPVSYTGLDAGTSIALNGPNGAQSLTKVTQPVTLPGFYQVTLNANYLTAGTYTATGSGGTNVGPFTTSLTLPTPFAWTNASSVATVTRSQGVTINWTGGAGSGFVTITGSSLSTVGTTDYETTFTCLGNGANGTFTIPPSVLLALPATQTLEGIVVLPGTISVGSEVYTPFTATGLDYALFGYITSTSQSVVFQ